jgi:hypothetical protein
MRKITAVLLGCLVLTGCGASWDQELRYKIVSIDRSTPTEFFDLELVGEAPKGALKPDGLSRQSMQPYEITGGAGVGDEVLCVVEQKKGNAFEDSNVVTNVRSCRKA